MSHEMRASAFALGLAVASEGALGCGLSVEGMGAPEPYVGARADGAADATSPRGGEQPDGGAEPDVWRPPASDASAGPDAPPPPPPCTGHYCEGDPTCRAGEKCFDCGAASGLDFFCPGDRVCRRTCGACSDKFETFLCDGTPYGRCRDGSTFYQHCGCANGNPSGCPYGNQVCVPVPFTTGQFVCSTCGEIGSSTLACKRGGYCSAIARSCF
jgi:hypothetical protein